MLSAATRMRMRMVIADLLTHAQIAVRATSTIGHGTTFTVTLPSTHADAEYAP